MSTPQAWLTRSAAAAAQHPAAHKQHSRTQRIGSDREHAYAADYYAGAALHEPHAAPSVQLTLPWAMGTNQAGDELYSTLTYNEARDLSGRRDTRHLDGAEDTFPNGVDELAFGAPGLAKAMVHQEVSARESAEQKLGEERARCELLQHEIQRLQAQLSGAPLDWKCPICCAIVCRAEKDEHGKRCLTQFVEFVQNGSVGMAGGR